MNATRPSVPDPAEAIVLDLDGVVTDTASLHRAAWKETFDAFLRRARPEQPLFDPERDYRDHVDGLPRHEGVRAFLASRGIELPEGRDRDTLADGTVRGIASDKNDRFRRLLTVRGADVFPDAVDRIRAWRDAGLPVAVVSSSRNCRSILDAAGLRRLFDVRVDGETMDELGLPGKPDPALFLEAADRLGVDPARAAAIEDATSGVRSAARGGFGLVVGVDREGTRGDALREHGADVVVASLEGLEADLAAGTGRRDAAGTGSGTADGARDAASERDPAPALLQHLDALAERLDGRRPAVFLDFDGTLSPIVARPGMAELLPGMRDRLRRLADRVPVAIVSGRDREDVRRRVGLADLVCAGSHGFDIAGPNGLHLEHHSAEAALPELDVAEAALREAVASIEGVEVERKRFGIAVHYRNVPDADVPRVEDAVRAAAARQPSLRRSSGKKVLELQPDLEWDKGRAVRWLLEALELDRDDVVPFYVGDDVTDEDAFAALPERGVGVLVAEEPRATAAAFRVDGPGEVGLLLDWLADRAAGHGPSATATTAPASTPASAPTAATTTTPSPEDA